MDLNVLIIGGGIHGVGILHDLATRNVHGVHLVEKNILSSGTSSRSTKLIHGGLRYLEHLNQWSLVYEALHERGLLLQLLKGIVKPLPFVLPNFKGDKRPPCLIRLGLFFYDLLAGDGGLPSASAIHKNEIIKFAPYLNQNKIDKEMISAFLYYDAQMLDDVIVKIAAAAAEKLGATFEEQAKVTEIKTISDGFKVTITKGNSTTTVTTKKIINATGAWANENLLKWGILPKIACLLNLGTHIVFNPEVVPNANINNCAATLIQELDGRIVFFIPWFDKWLYGTTESILETEPSKISCPKNDKKYLMQTAEETLNLYKAEENISEMFCGVRCMPLKPYLDFKNLDEKWCLDPYNSPFYLKKLDKNISSLSRETVIEETMSGLFSIYGGKYTTYRAIAQKIGSMICRQLKVGSSSGTHLQENWFLKNLLEEKPDIFKSNKSIRQN